MVDRVLPAALVGRDRDLATLAAALRTAQAGRLAAVILSGEAGVGKTRLVQELAGRAERAGATLLWGAAIDIAESPPFWPVASALRTLLRSRRGRGAAELLAPWTEQIDDVLAPGPADAPSGTATLELFRRVVLELAADTVVVIVVEDLQWVDRSTRDLLVYLIAELTGERVLLVLTHRAEQQPSGAPVRALIAELQRHRQVRFEEVAPLSRDAIAALVRTAAPDDPELTELVWQRSAGNAFIAEETLRAALGGDPQALPHTLRDLVLSRVGLLSPAVQRVVRAVAVSDGPVPHSLLAAVSDVPEPELLGALRDAVDAGVVVVDNGSDGYRLRHGLMTDVVVAELLPGERIDLHRRYATALEESRTSDLPGVDARLAHHWQRAGDSERALAAAVAAAESADSVRGHAEAHRHWLHAARLAGETQEQARCLERAAEAAHLAGDHDQAVALLSELLEEAAAEKRPGLHSRTGWYLLGAGRGAEAVHAFRQARAELPADAVAAALADVLSGLATALRHTGEFAASRAVADEALAVARRAGLAAVEARALAHIGFSLAYLEDPEAGSAALDEALSVAERAGEPVDVGRAYISQAELLSGPLNELERGIEVARAGAERVIRLGLGRSLGVALLSLQSNGLFRLGRWDDAEQVIEEARALAPTGADVLELRLARARLRTGRGDLAAAEDDLEAVEVLSASSGGPRYRIPLLTLRAGLDMWRGRPDRALEYVCAGLDIVEQGSDDVWLVAPLVWHGARARAEHTRLGMRHPDAAVSARLRRHAGELTRRASASVPAIRDVVLGFVQMCAAEDTRADGRSDPDLWEQVAQVWEPRHQPYPTAYARMRRAEALFARRNRSTAGAELLLAAERTARAMGAAPFLVEIAELAERAKVGLVGPQPTPTPQARPDAGQGVRDELEGITARELEVLTELARGLTNKEIAQRLFISEKTVGVHVSRIYAKIDVHTRVQATAVLHRARPELRDTASRH